MYSALFVVCFGLITNWRIKIADLKTYNFLYRYFYSLPVKNLLLSMWIDCTHIVHTYTRQSVTHLCSDQDIYHPGMIWFHRKQYRGYRLVTWMVFLEDVFKRILGTFNNRTTFDVDVYVYLRSKYWFYEATENYIIYNSIYFGICLFNTVRWLSVF